MPTARELLEQADALMRRNRARTETPPAPPSDIPELTEAVDVPIAEAEAQADAAPSDGRTETDDASHRAQSAPEPAPVLALDDVPVLTDVVEEIEAPTIVEAADAQDEVSQWADVDRGEASITGPLPDSIVVVPPASMHAANEAPLEPRDFYDDGETPIEITAPEPTDSDDRGDETDIDELALDELEAPIAPSAEPPSASAVLASARTLAAHHEPPTDVAIPADDDERWDALAEEIRMQVLQRIDIFTDTGLREQLTARLQPIVDRASADLVATINQHVGQLLRTYVAEAIEREIEKWRHGE